MSRRRPTDSDSGTYAPLTDEERAAHRGGSRVTARGLLLAARRVRAARRARGPLTVWVARRRAVRRRRLVALAVVGAVVILTVVVILDHRPSDAFAGTWKGAGSGSLVVAHVNGADYTVVVGSSHKVRVALCSGDRLTIAAVAATAQAAQGAPAAKTTGATSSAAANATLGTSAAVAPGSSSRVIVLKPGPSRGTLEECFADGTSTVLTRD